jgi:hypothetical protein
MSKTSLKLRRVSEIWLAPPNFTALVTSSETISSAVSVMSSLIPSQDSRKKRVYRRAQDEEAGSSGSAILPTSAGRAWPEPA